MTKLSAFHRVIRSLLQDEEIEGCWGYPDEACDSLVRAAFAVQAAPTGYSLVNASGVACGPATIHQGAGVMPDMVFDASFAKLCLEAALIAINGEDGAGSIKTRMGEEKSQGDRKRALEADFRKRLRAIAGGNVDGVSWLGVTDET
jgi:hypothetical protein